MPGPLPNAQKRRRNQPTLPQAELSAAGRTGRVPAKPAEYDFGKPARAWWNWAWKLPQATKWDAGAHYLVARRALLEDDLAALELAGEFDLEDVLAAALTTPPDELREVASNLKFIIGRLKSLAGGRVSIMKEMRELDNRLGLNPKAMADLRWTVAEPEPTAKAKKRAKAKGVAQLDDYRDRLG